MMANRQEDFQELAAGAALAAHALSEPTPVRREASRWRDAFLLQLEREFLPPLERRDLAFLAERIAAVSLHLTEDAGQTMPPTLRTAFRACADALCAVVDALPQFRRPERFHPALAALRRSAEAAQALCAAAGQTAGIQAFWVWRSSADAFSAAAEAAAAAALNGF